MKKFCPIAPPLSLCSCGFKQLFISCLVFVLGGFATSCTSDKSEGVVSQAENTFSYAGAQSKIESVVYTYDEEERVYTFYFSPTKGLISLDAMLLADDYIKIETKTPAGDVELGTGMNSLKYKDIDISAATADLATRSSSSLYILLTSTTTLKMSLNVTSGSGVTLVGDYYGLCVRHTDKDTVDQTPTLDTQIFARYQGSIKAAGTNNYYLAVTNTKYSGSGTSFDLTEEGYALVLDFYGTPGDSWMDMPVGVFSESAGKEDHTYYSDYSSVIYVNAQGEKRTMPLVGDVTILQDEESGEVTINATYLDADYQEHEILFQGQLTIANGTFNAALPQLGRDLTIEGFDCQAIYMGDYFSTGSGMMQIVIQDRKIMNGEIGGAGITLDIFHRKFNDPNDICLEPDTYSASQSLLQRTWLPGTELSVMGMVFPFGTYAFYDDGSQSGLYTYPATGDIVIANAADGGYRITFDLITADGYSVKGSYEGKIYIEDQSDDNEDDGSSTLESDLELDLDYQKRANCYPSDDRIYIGAYGFQPISEIYTGSPAAPGASNPEYRCSYQYIDIGLETGTYDKTDPDYQGWIDESDHSKGVVGKLVPGDIFRIDLLVKEGDGDKITPGTYTVSANRYPASMYPGVCLRGYQSGEGHIGTRWLYLDSAWGQGAPYGYTGDPEKVKNDQGQSPTNRASMMGYASLYTGTVVVEKAEGGDNWFTFKIEGEDVLHHKITGTWTGPVYLGNSDTPVVSSGKELDGNDKPVVTSAGKLSKVPSKKDAPQVLSAVKARYNTNGKLLFR